MNPRRGIGLLALLLGGCAAALSEDAAGDSFQDDDPPIGCQTGTAGCGDDDDSSDAPGAPVGASCDNTNQCEDDAICAAPFEDGEAGDLVCQLGCIQLGDEALWCSDDDSCCAGTCSSRGLCTVDEADGGSDTMDDASESGDSTGTTGDDATGGDSTGTGDSGSTSGGSTG